MIYFDEEDKMNKRLQKRTFTLNRYLYANHSVAGARAQTHRSQNGGRDSFQ